jgi:hypothetical protein
VTVSSNLSWFLSFPLALPGIDVDVEVDFYSDTLLLLVTRLGLVVSLSSSRATER